MRRYLAVVPLLALCSAAPVGLLALFGKRMVMPPLWVHFYGVGATALVATAAAVALTTAGARVRDGRTVIVGGAFTVMAALLAVHGLMTPGVLVGDNGLIALSGGLTLPAGAAVLFLAAFPNFTSPRAIPRVIALQVFLAAAIVWVSLVGILAPDVVPAVPAARSAPAWLLFAVGLVLLVAVAVRAAQTYLLTRRVMDLAVVFGLALLGAALYGALVLSFMDLGWWLGHVFEVLGIGLVGTSAAYDLRRGRRSRPLAGDLRAGEIVVAEEAYLGARVRALMVRLGEKDTSTEAHTRRVAALAVDVGEVLGLSATRLRSLAIGGLLHDIGKLSVPTTILRKPAALEDDEYELIKLHPQRGYELLSELGGFDDSVKRLVHNHHERLDRRGYPRALEPTELDVETRILTVCDVYDALVSTRVYRPAWTRADALALLREETGTAFDPRCVDALIEVLRPNVAELRPVRSGQLSRVG
jgi:HD-GYP domain-containing protein (c-di-GMP phosphodiesterase class II)